MPLADDHDLPTLEPTPPGLYRHYKGGWYEVIATARCSETLQGMTVYRPLYGEGGLWVRPAAMFNETGLFAGRQQSRFSRQDPASVLLADLPTAHALIRYLRNRAQEIGIDLDAALRPPPPEPTTCCGRGCNGCVWEGYYSAMNYWRDDVCDLLSQHAKAALRTAPTAPAAQPV